MNRYLVTKFTGQNTLKQKLNEKFISRQYTIVSNQYDVSDSEVLDDNICDSADIGLNGEIMHHNERPQWVLRSPAWARSVEYVMD